MSDRRAAPQPVAGAGRYAPSPSADLHLGNLRTAVVAWLMARSTGRNFCLRIDDLDTARSHADIAHRQLADLAALGLDHDGPVVWQSTRTAAYAAAVDSLAGDTFECFCTRREITEAVRAPHLPADAYPGTCAELSDAERDARRRDRPAALRVRAHKQRQTIHDHWAGQVTAEVDDFVIRRNDGAYAYNLAVVVDDGAAGVDQVVRGADLLESSPRQAWLASRLGITPPSYGHVGLVTNPDGRRLAKRDGAITLRELAARGLSPTMVLGIIATSLNLAAPGEKVTPGTLLTRFDPAQRPPQWVWRPENTGLNASQAPN